MSAILAVCGENFCAMVSDGRMVEEPVQGGSPKIITNDLPKLRKVNRNVLVGFAGDTLAAVQIVNALGRIRHQRADAGKNRAHPARKSPGPSRRSRSACGCLSAGAGRKGGFVLTSLGSDAGYEPQTQPARAGAYLIEGACSHSDIGPYLEQKVKPEAANWKGA